MANSKPSAELAGLARRLSVLQKIYFDCVRSENGCAFRRRNQHCPECIENFAVCDQIREIVRTPHWTPSGFADGPTPPRAIRSNPRACAAWRASWRTACAVADLIEQQQQ